MNVTMVTSAITEVFRDEIIEKNVARGLFDIFFASPEALLRRHYKTYWLLAITLTIKLTSCHVSN